MLIPFPHASAEHTDGYPVHTKPVYTMQLTQAVELEDPVSHYSFACTTPFGHCLVQTSAVDGDPPTHAQY